jgi:hypothetical protein
MAYRPRIRFADRRSRATLISVYLMCVPPLLLGTAIVIVNVGKICRWGRPFAGFDADGIGIDILSVAVFTLLNVLMLAMIWRTSRARFIRRPRPGVCPNCGYDLRATPSLCPECGTGVRVNSTSVSQDMPVENRD